MTLADSSTSFLTKTFPPVPDFFNKKADPTPKNPMFWVPPTTFTGEPNSTPPRRARRDGPSDKSATFKPPAHAGQKTACSPNKQRKILANTKLVEETILTGASTTAISYTRKTKAGDDRAVQPFFRLDQETAPPGRGKMPQEKIIATAERKHAFPAPWPPHARRLDGSAAAAGRLGIWRRPPRGKGRKPGSADKLPPPPSSRTR